MTVFLFFCNIFIMDQTTELTTSYVFIDMEHCYMQSLQTFTGVHWYTL